MLESGPAAFSGIAAGALAIVAGILVLAFPHLLSYLVGGWVLISGAAWLAAGGLVPGIVSIVAGLLIFALPHVINYTAGITWSCWGCGSHSSIPAWQSA